MTENQRLRYLCRAKRTDNGEWVEGFYHWTNWINPQTKEIVDVTHSILPIGCQDSYNVDPSTICQCTGLKDKDGNLIWENDLIKTFNSSGDEWSLSQIVFEEYSLNVGWCVKGIKTLHEYNHRLFDVGFGTADAGRCKVVGNIFDNPELLVTNNSPEHMDDDVEMEDER